MKYCFNCGEWVEPETDDRGQDRCPECGTLVGLSKP